MKLTCVVVPIYKVFSCLNEDEILSLNQLFKILGEHDIFLICAHQFDPIEYLNRAKEFNTFPKIKKLSGCFFLNIEGYNRLMRSTNFYKKFNTYSFLLIYQLDAFVFRDDLNYWCKKGYDYIGAAWFEGWNEGNHTSKFIGIGNGGFSLRKIDSTIKLLTRGKRLSMIKSFWMKSNLNYLLPFTKLVSRYRMRFNLRNIDTIENVFRISDTNEDYYITQILGNTFCDFMVAPYSESIKFSFEVNPSLLYTMNQNNLPFGCHAWGKYEPEFWKKFIYYPNN